MGGTCGKKEETKMHIKFWWGNLKEEYPGRTCEESCVVIIKETGWISIGWILLKIGVRKGLL
jgi:hypothetical protein